MPEQPGLFSDNFAAEVIETPVADEMSESFLAYSLSVITARAIPDVRDGLKPVQRRILYSMLQQGIRPDGDFRKCAGVVGDTMGKYHPHGDSAIYETLVRMGQDFTRNVTFITPQGNFGTLDDPPAAYRYTECKLSPAAMAMVREIGEDTVEYRPTFDGLRDEPEVLPGLIPNLLVNGTTGIAVGMATNMPTHNLREVYDAIELVMTKRRPKPTTEQLMKVLPGPDFPSGGIVVDDGLREAYETGRGTFRVRAKAETIKLTRSRQALVITELPYMVGPEKIITRINELASVGKLPGVDEREGAKNLSDKTAGMRIQIDLRPGANSQAVLANLYRLTPLEETFGVNNVVLVNGVPTTVGVWELCHRYVEHRLDVIVRRTRFRLEKWEARLHIVAGLLIALDNIDRVIQIIRGSSDGATAKALLIEEFDLSEVQAEHILDMRLRKLTALEVQKLEDEADELEAKITDAQKLLASEQRQRTLVLKELKEAVDEYGTDRRTEIRSDDEYAAIDLTSLETNGDDDVPDVPCVLTLSTSGMAGRAPTEGAKRATPGRHDILVASRIASTRSPVFAITSDGNARMAHALELNEVGGRSRGTEVRKAFGTNKGEEVLTIVAPGTDAAESLVLVTANGVAKRLNPDEIAGTRSGTTIIKLKPNDSLAAAFTAPEGTDVAIVASDGQVLRTTIDSISVQGRNAAGVSGMKLRDGATVIGAGVIIGDEAIVTVTDRGTAKVTPASEFESKGRGGVGVRITRFTDEKSLRYASICGLEDLLAIVGSDDDPTKPAPDPVPVTLEPTKRDLVSTATDQPILAVGPARW
ncbi:MAG: DNA gyrase/topoisomerase IV subunit A [Acidimicrobiales bacterium]